jgi:hypothetical protein
MLPSNAEIGWSSLDGRRFRERVYQTMSLVGTTAKCRLRRAMSDVEGKSGKHMLVPSSSRFEPKRNSYAQPAAVTRWVGMKQASSPADRNS